MARSLDRIVARVEYHADHDGEEIPVIEALVDASAITAFEAHIDDGSLREWLLSPQPLVDTYRLCYEALRSPQQMKLRRMAGTDHLPPSPTDGVDAYAEWLETVAIADVRDEFPVGDPGQERYTSRAAQEVVAIALATGQPIDAILDAPIEIWDELCRYVKDRIDHVGKHSEAEAIAARGNAAAKGVGRP